MAAGSEHVMSAGEVLQYDRQIRLWGQDAQNQISGSAILVVNLCGLAAEVCKNLVLAGVGKLVFLDDGSLVGPSDLETNFLFSQDTASKNKAQMARNYLQILNAFVSLEILPCKGEPDLLHHLHTHDPNYDLVLSFNNTAAFTTSLAETCLKRHTKLIYAYSHGLFAYFGSQLYSYTYHQQQPPQRQPLKTKKGSNAKTLIFETAEFPCFDAHLFRDLEDSKQHRIKEYLTKHARSISWLLFATQAYYYSCATTAAKKRTSAMSEFVNLYHKYVEDFCSARPDLQTISKHKLEHFFQHARVDFSPVCTILGGVLAQESLKILTQQGPPLQTHAFFDGTDNSLLINNLNFS